MSARTSVTNPVELASSAGVRSCAFHKLGDGRWSGVVYAEDGSELEIEELASSWRCVDGTVAKTLELLVRQLLEQHR